MDTTLGRSGFTGPLTGTAPAYTPASPSSQTYRSPNLAAPSANSATTSLIDSNAGSNAGSHAGSHAGSNSARVTETITATAPLNRGYRAARQSPRPPIIPGVTSKGTSSRRGDIALTIAGIGLGITLGLGVSSAINGLAFAGGVFLAASTFSALAGTYLCLALMVLISRLPWLEREIGHDRMVKLHRSVAPYSILLIALHAIFSTLGHAQAASDGVLHALWVLITATEWMMPAAAALVLMVSLSVMSYRRVRSKMKYETWWVSHLYFYAAVALAFGHQIALGPMFVANPAQRLFWIGLYVFVGGSIVISRFILPAMFSRKHGLRVAAVVPESNGVVSVYLSGHDLDLIKARGGQFFQWRFMTRHWWWQAHPYSLSASPNQSWLRITVKDLGDHSANLSDLKPGTRVWAEGPYGVFTASARHTERVTAFAAGVGITPIRAVLDDLPSTTDVTVIYRVSDTLTAPLRAELDHIAAAYGWTVHYLEGSRTVHPMSPEYLGQLAPGMSRSDVYVCGPDTFTESVIGAAQAMGVPSRRIHHEAFSF